jgi:hypothetical protein
MLEAFKKFKDEKYERYDLFNKDCGLEEYIL